MNFNGECLRMKDLTTLELSSLSDTMNFYHQPMYYIALRKEIRSCLFVEDPVSMT